MTSLVLNIASSAHHFIESARERGRAPSRICQLAHGGLGDRLGASCQSSVSVRDLTAGIAIPSFLSVDCAPRHCAYPPHLRKHCPSGIPLSYREKVSSRLSFDYAYIHSNDADR